MAPGGACLNVNCCPYLSLAALICVLGLCCLLARGSSLRFALVGLENPRGFVGIRGTVLVSGLERLVDLIFFFCISSP